MIFIGVILVGWLTWTICGFIISPNIYRYENDYYLRGGKKGHYYLWTKVDPVGMNIYKIDTKRQPFWLDDYGFEHV